jgi:hypothetical protein
MEYRFAQGWSLAGEIARLAVSKKQDPGHPWKQEKLVQQVDAPPFVIFKGWGFRFAGAKTMGGTKFPTLAKNARMGTRRTNTVLD